MAAVDYGADMRVILEDGVFDLDPTGALDTPLRALAMAILRRFVVRTGDLFYDESYGFDLRGVVGKAMTRGELFRVRSRVASECKKDERVDSAKADLRFDPNENKLFVRISCTSGVGPFTLTLAADALSVDLLALDLPEAA